MNAPFEMGRLSESDFDEILRQSQWCRGKCDPLSDWLRDVVVTERSRRREKGPGMGEFGDFPCERWDNRTVSLALACTTSISYGPHTGELAAFFDLLAKAAVALSMSRLELIASGVESLGR